MRSSVPLRCVVAVGLLWFAARPARGQGGPPLLIDDTETPGNRRWEINLAFTIERTPVGQTVETPLVDANYGLGDRLQLKIEMPWLVESPDTTPSHRGAGNALIGVKWRFVDEDGATPALGFYPQIRLAAAGQDVGEDPAVLLPLSVQKAFGPISLNGEVGYVYHRDQLNQWIGGLAVGHEFSKRFEGLVEIFASTDRRLRQARALFHAGARWELGAHETLLVSVGRGFGNAPDDPNLDAYLGLQTRF